MKNGIRQGDKAHDFQLRNTFGELKNLKNFKKPLALYFYPKDNTSGCTKQACNLRDNLKKLERAGTTIVGISPDDSESHKKFAEEHNLAFELLCDHSHKIAEA